MDVNACKVYTKVHVMQGEGRVQDFQIERA